MLTAHWQRVFFRISVKEAHMNKKRSIGRDLLGRSLHSAGRNPTRDASIRNGGNVTRRNPKQLINSRRAQARGRWAALRDTLAWSRRVWWGRDNESNRKNCLMSTGFMQSAAPAASMLTLILLLQVDCNYFELFCLLCCWIFILI